jgi:hypothetical protein
MVTVVICNKNNKQECTRKEVIWRRKSVRGSLLVAFWYTENDTQNSSNDLNKNISYAKNKYFDSQHKIEEEKA